MSTKPKTTASTSTTTVRTILDRHCGNCIYYTPYSDEVPASCHFDPFTRTVTGSDFCSHGKFMDSHINPAGNSRLYNFEGETIGWYYWLVELEGGS